MGNVDPVFWLGGIVGLAIGLSLGMVTAWHILRNRQPPKTPVGLSRTMVTENQERWLRVALELKRQHMDRFFQRRQVEWRVSVALWGGVAVAANALRQVKPGPTAQIVLASAAGLVFVLHAVWAWAFNLRGAIPNRDAGYELENLIRVRLGMAPVAALRYLGFFAHYWQVVVTGLLLSGAVYLVVAGSR
jgi:hypothetical protein